MSDAFAAEIHQHRDALLRIARLQLRDNDLAEDVVQETLLAAMRSRGNFAGRSKLRTWLVGILKFKLIDALRRSARDPIPASRLEQEIRTEDLDALFDEEGIWRAKPERWNDPLAQIHQSDFLRVLELCLTKLPANSARVFMLRELFGLDSAEICRVVSISRNHLGVLLFRARMSLRRCLETNWFEAAPEIG